MDVNHILGYDATLQSSGIGVSNVVGLAFTSPTLLDVSTSSSLYQYNTITHSSTFLFNFANNTQIAGIANTSSALLGMQYSPSPGGVDQIGAGGAITQGGPLQELPKPRSFRWPWVNRGLCMCQMETIICTLII
jgi:hypothetical protein